MGSTTSSIASIFRRGPVGKLRAGRIGGRAALFLLPDQFGQIIVDSSAMADGHHADNVMRTIHGVDDPETANPVLQEAFEVPLKRLPDRRVLANGPKRGLDRPLDVRREVAEDIGYMRRNVELKRPHYRLDFVVFTSGSPNTSSNDSPFPPLA